MPPLANDGRKPTPEAITQVESALLMRPGLLGPTTRRPVRRASSVIRRSSSAPSSPTSEKPDEKITAPPTPASAHSSMPVRTLLWGSEMTARSMGSSAAAAAMLGAQGRPSMTSRAGLTGTIRPSKP